MGSTQKKLTRTLGVRTLALATALAAALLVATTPAAASGVGGPLQQSALKSQMETVGQFISIVIAFVAIPNGAFGVFQYMTAGTDTEQSDKGRKRIRNSFVGVAGAGAIMIAVQLLTSMLGIGSNNGGSNNAIEPLIELQTTIATPLLDAQAAILQAFHGF